MKIAILTSQELGKIGFTTMFDLEKRQIDHGAQIDSHTPSSRGESPQPDTDRSAASAPSPATGASAQKTQGSIEQAAASEERAKSPDFDASIPSMAPRPQDLASRSETKEYEEISNKSTGVEIYFGDDERSRPVVWTVSTKGSPHAVIVGIPGQGKSVTTRRIISDFSKHGIAPIVFDFHGDMAAKASNDVNVVDASAGLHIQPFEVTAKNYVHAAFEIAEILEVVGDLGRIQRDKVYEALKQCYEANGFSTESNGDTPPSMAQFVEALTKIDAKGQGGATTVARLRPFTEFDLFAEDSTEQLSLLDSRGTVIDLSGLGQESVQLAASSFILRNVYKQMFSWEQNSELKVAIVLDEAHRLKGDVTLPKLMKEGRKYGLSVIVASQALDDFSQQVVENAGTKVIFRCNFPASKKVGAMLRGGKGEDLSEKIENLQVGQAYVSTADHPTARKTFMIGDNP